MSPLAPLLVASDNIVVSQRSSVSPQLLGELSPSLLLPASVVDEKKSKPDAPSSSSNALDASPPSPSRSAFSSHDVDLSQSARNESAASSACSLSSSPPSTGRKLMRPTGVKLAGSVGQSRQA